jgi:transposase
MADRMWPEAVAGDKGYSSAELRNWLLHRDVAAVIPYRDDEMGPKAYDRTLYRERPMSERAINRLKRLRRIATRYDKLAANFMAMVTIAMILEWL